ncbi:MFS general substrate transporter [Rhodotorula sp. JG-1b]|nr:MFS general substrate transporter [Rhodotorula sp. JG-1b]
MLVEEVKTHLPKHEFVGEEAVAVKFAKGDPEDPATGWPRAKRYRALLLAMAVTYASAFNATANGAASGGFRKEHPDVTTSVFQTSSFTYLAMLGIGPLVLAPVSETFGRRPQIVVCTFIIMLLFLGQALAPNVYSLIFCRWIQGTAACIEGPTAAGVVADLWPKRTRGPAMSLFVLTVFTANATGPLVANWVAFKTNWHWVYWVQLCSNAVVFVLCLFLFPEPRADVILAKRCAKLQKETGKPHYVDGADHFEGWAHALRVSCSRPLQYLFTEPIILALSLYAGLAWACVFLFVGAIAHVFEVTYGFSQGQAGTVLICGFIGAAISYILHLTIQEPLYRRWTIAGHGKAAPEVRLYPAAIGGILFAAGCFGFAWTARPHIHWIVPCIFICMFNIGIYSIYLGTYLMISECYDRYSSSGQAAQSLLRNILGSVFPFFGIAMYDNLGFPWASSTLGFISGVMALIPWLLIYFGPRLRARSKIARSMEHQEGEIIRLY